MKQSSRSKHARGRAASRASNKGRRSDAGLLPSEQPQNGVVVSVLLRIAGLSVLWMIAAVSLATRTHLVMGYGTLRSLTPGLEPFAADLTSILVAAAIIGPWGFLRSKRVTASSDSRVTVLQADCWLAVSLLPLLISVFEIVASQEVPRLFWEPLWLAAATGMSYFCLLSTQQIAEPEQEAARWPFAAACSLCCGVGLWWFVQAVYYHQSFMLGFNDFGHFAQRIANTAAGNGMLLETPVLPVFWDHFNPGLLLLVPLWIAWPDEQLFFALQAIALSGSGIGIYSIARRLEFSPRVSLLFCTAWLVQPVVGQMNLAYTYGWHPITLAIPLLLLGIDSALAKRFWLAALATLLAMSMEEGVIVVVAIWSFTSAARLYCASYLGVVSDESTMQISARVWMTLALASVVAFILVFKLSGLADFQTGRFVALGDSLIEVVLSPVLRPGAFWGQLVRPQSAAFLLCIALPVGLVSLWRAKYMLLAFLPPLGVLLVWDHAPATSLAFQYSSSLLPLLWFAAMEGARRLPSRKGLPAAALAACTGAILSLYVGQLPFSRDSLVEVKAATYRANSEMHRERGAEDSIWLLERLDEIRSREVRVLATGRIAAHLVGCRDVETVGQFIQRRKDLELLVDRASGALQHYDWIVLDLNEGFQQSREQTDTLYQETLDLKQGDVSVFQLVHREYQIAILKRVK